MLVHSPLVGPYTWQPVAEVLRRRGFPVQGVPSGFPDRPPYHAKLVEAARSVRGDVVVGHSGAGALLPAIAQHGDRGMVFVDAVLPRPGRSWFETAPPALGEQLLGLAREGWLPPWHEWFPREAFEDLPPRLRDRFFAEVPRLPLAFFEEPAPAAPESRSAYVRLSETYDLFADEAARRGWPVYRENADHLAMLTQPDRIADVVVRAVESVLP